MKNEDYESVMDDIDEFNEKYPHMQVTGKTIAKSIKSSKANQKNAVNGIVMRKKMANIMD